MDVRPNGVNRSGLGAWSGLLTRRRLTRLLLSSAATESGARRKPVPEVVEWEESYRWKEDGAIGR
jgi:hypothetical protein